MDLPLRTHAIPAPAVSPAELSRVLEESARILRDHAAACPPPGRSRPDHPHPRPRPRRLPRLAIALPDEVAGRIVVYLEAALATSALRV